MQWVHVLHLTIIFSFTIDKLHGLYGAIFISFTLVCMFHCCYFEHCTWSISALYFRVTYNWLYCILWRINTLISVQIIYMISFILSDSLPDSISVVTQRQISSACVYSDLLSWANHSHSDIQSNTMYLTLTVTTTVVTFLFTLIKDFLLYWCYLSPAPPPTGHRSTVTVYVSMSAVCVIMCYKKWSCAEKVKTHRSI